MVWIESPSNPLLKLVDLAAGRPPGPTRTSARETSRPSWSSTTRSRRPWHPATAGAGRGHRLPLRDQVPGGPLGHHQRRPRHLPDGPVRATEVPPERDRRGARALRLLPGDARPAHARAAHGASLGERAAGRGGARGASGRRQSSAIPGWHPGRTRIPRRRWPARQMRCWAAWSRSSSRRLDGRTAEERAIRFCESTRLFTLAESLGGVESLCEVPR